MEGVASCALRAPGQQVARATRMEFEHEGRFAFRAIGIRHFHGVIFG
jgi:hypothetical protein